MRLVAPVRCEPTAAPLALTLRGAAAPPDTGTLMLVFAGAAPADLPGVLGDTSVESLGGQGYRITSDGRSWPITAAAMTVMREVAEEFYRALPPRPVPAGKRLLWRLILKLAASRRGLVLLRALRR
jgi:hypothetical protein